jgi:hypothetical protein
MRVWYKAVILFLLLGGLLGCAKSTEADKPGEQLPAERFPKKK